MARLEDALLALAERAEALPEETLLERIETQLGAEVRPRPIEFEAPTPPRPPRRRLGPAVALAAAAVVLVLIGGIIFLARPFGDEDSPVATEAPVVTAAPEGRRPEALVPTGAQLLTISHDYAHLVHGTDGFIWAGGAGHVVRLDPVTGEYRIWNESDDAAFGMVYGGLAPARDGGVWMILEDGSLRWFDGELFRDVVAALPLHPDDRDQIESVVEAADGSLLASTFADGVFRWDGSQWSLFDDARPAPGAGALAVGSGGAIWVGNVEQMVSARSDWEIGRGLSRYDVESWETFTADDASALSGIVLTITPLPDGGVLVGTETGLARFDGGSWSDFDPALIGFSRFVYSTVGPDGTIWAATDRFPRGGAVLVSSFDGFSWTTYGPTDGLPDDQLSTAPIAIEAGVFIGTSGGIYRLVDGDWTEVPITPEPAPPPPPGTTPLLVGIEGMETSADSLWVWGEDGAWRYTDGAWSEYSHRTSSDVSQPGDVVYVGDTGWMVNEFGVFSFNGDDWVELESAPARVWRLAADPDSGTLWLSTGEDLYRWDGAEMTNVGHPSNWPDGGEGYVGDIAVAVDGSVWAAGLYGYVPEWGGLARYDDATGSWEPVRPLGGDEDVPAWSMAAASDGDLWVVLSKWAQGWEGAPLPTWALAHRDGVTGEWTVFDQGLPEGFPTLMAVGNDGVWAATGQIGDFEAIGGILWFDGETWTRYLEETDPDDTIDEIAVAPDGTVWYLQNGALHQLTP